MRFIIALALFCIATTAFAEGLTLVPAPPINEKCKECQYHDFAKKKMVCVTAEKMGAILAKESSVPTACRHGLSEKVEAAKAAALHRGKDK